MTREEIIEKYPLNRDSLLLILHDLQNSHPEKYLETEDLRLVAHKLNITYSAVYGVVKYYSMFSLKPRGKYIVRVCKSPVCHMMANRNFLDEVKNALQVELGETTEDGLFTLEASECLGQCADAPVIIVNEKVYKEVDNYKLNNIFKSIRMNENQK